MWAYDGAVITRVILIIHRGVLLRSTVSIFLGDHILQRWLAISCYNTDGYIDQPQDPPSPACCDTHIAASDASFGMYHMECLLYTMPVLMIRLMQGAVI